MLEGQMLGASQDEALFNAVRLDAESGIVQWPSGADFDPEMLRKWTAYGDEFAPMEW